jgi:dTDP-4-dehydrorhamnose 3,5-epimerase-like enzyme
MRVAPTAIPDVFFIEPKVFGDSRGFLNEDFNQRDLNTATGTGRTRHPPVSPTDFGHEQIC